MEDIMRSFNLMGFVKPKTQSFMQRLRTGPSDIMKISSVEANDDHEEGSSIFANSPIANCEITGKRKEGSTCS